MLPPELARKISPWIVNSAQMTGVVGKTTLIAVTVFCLYGPFGINPDHNGYLYLMGPWVCPAFVALCLSAVLARKSFKIYRGNPFAEHHHVEDDPAVTRLSDLCNSDEAHQHLWWETFKLCCILFVMLGVAAFYYRDLLEWNLPSAQNGFLLHPRAGEPGAWFWGGVFGCSMFTFLILMSDYQRWCLLTWAKRESANNAAQD
jgi:hypothetical protein